LAAILNVGHGWAGFKDAVLEIGAASVPLLFTVGTGNEAAAAECPSPIRRDGTVIGLSLGLYAIFVATLGRGLYG
jgi:hypothetical protein